MNETWIDRSRLTIIGGHYGSGKTEVAVNLALRLADMGYSTAIADLDVVNPYFRSRERAEEFERNGIRLIATSQACVDADLPVMPAELNALLQSDTVMSVLDIGGDAAGARVLARYAPQILCQDYQFLFVLNANRPQTATAEQAMDYMEGIQAVTGLHVTGIIHNTHLCGAPCEEDILYGAKTAESLSALSGLPVLCHVMEESTAGNLRGMLKEPVFPISIYMKKPWEEE